MHTSPSQSSRPQAQWTLLASPVLPDWLAVAPQAAAELLQVQLHTDQVGSGAHAQPEGRQQWADCQAEAPVHAPDFVLGNDVSVPVVSQQQLQAAHVHDAAQRADYQDVGMLGAGVRQVLSAAASGAVT